ncbi:MAG: peptide chain release factor 1 [Parcubacteria group bacterium]|nr:peptide chain release factor 1 [Parcubacteria group bacterium]|tara:strand:+ start:5053 stop:6096 length:1044 start_codon:yes stop_codon:yes gene_type:complete
MDKKITEIINKYEQLKTDLTDSVIISDQKKLKELSKQFNQLDPVIKKINELEKTEKQLEQAKNMLDSEDDQDMVTVAQEEVTSLNELKADLEKDIAEKLEVKDPLDQKNIIIEIRAGTGGDEAALFAGNLFRMYSRYAEDQNWKTKILSSNRTEIGGFKEVIFEIAGENVYSSLKYESGTHRVQRVPETEKSGRVHTSATTVAVLPEAEEIDLEIKAEDLRIDVFHAGGHGGQSVNTTDSAVRITHLPTGTVVSCQDEKSQQQNKAKGMLILKSRILASEQERIAKERGEERKSQIGSGDRSEKIRTYNFPQDRVTDHRIKQNFSQIDKIMDGDIQQIIDTLKKADK